jgi:hypothetical protein
VEFERNNLPGGFNYGTGKVTTLQVLAKKKFIDP